MANTVTINNIPSNFLELQDYSIQDDNLITNSTVQSTFDPLQNYVSYFIYNLNNEIIYTNEAGFSGWSFIDGQVYLDPQKDLEQVGFTIGNYNTLYTFLNNEVSSSIFNQYYIETISPDRTEIRLNTTQIANADVVNGATALIAKIQNSTLTYFDFYLNFGQNQLVIANNILLDNSNPNDPTILIKLYEPLPINFSLKDECWVVTQVAESIAYNINIVEIFEPLSDLTYLKGPNLNLNIKDQINNSTAYTNYATLSSSSYATGSNNLQYQINSILAERGVEINVDYSEYSNFIYFSSALTRLENFYYKLQLIEEYQYSSSIANLAGSSAQIITSKNIWEEKINEIITTFDGYDYFLYYESGSAAWPKTNSTYPYNNASTTSVAGITFIQNQSVVAGEYDENNNNALINAIPSYLREDPANAQYELFIEMLGEMFDNIWIYYQDVTEKWNADNRLQYGVSKDLVAGILRDLGIKIYQSGFGSADLYTALLGVTPSGSDFPFPYMTGSLPTPTGFEYINSSISASNQVVPLEDIEKGTYKRLYHNLPMLLKKKGTTVGIQDLITVYGIPSTILRVAEFGGKDKDETNDWDYYKQKYNYAYNNAELADWVGSEFQLNGAWSTTYTTNRPETVLFRFKTPGVESAGNTPQQTLFITDSTNVLLYLDYSGSINASGSWSGSTINPYNEYANLIFTPDGSVSASLYLPFFDGGWWTTAITVDGNGDFTLYAANNIYNGDDGSQIGFIASQSITGADFSQWDTATSASFGSKFGVVGVGIFSGSLQEIKYYTTAISDGSFRDITMNPDSIESTTLNSSPDQLAFRASLGGELYTGSVSIHPKVTGSWVTTSSFASDSNFYIGNPSNFVPNVETVYLDQPAAGIKNIVSNKIQIVDMNLPSGSTLSQYRSIQQQPPGGSTYTENLAYTEVAFSPQNEINDDIMDQLGFFNMGEFIGDPRQRFNQDTSYPDLDALRDAYFEKYVSNYDLNDYIRLIKFFDNSLFKMIKDFTPARSSLASGVVVKQTLLERNKYPQPEVTWSSNDYSGSIQMGYILGGAGGSVNNLNTPWCHFSASIAFGAVDAAYGSLYIGGNIDPISAGFFGFNGGGSQGTFTNQTGQDLKVRFRITLDNTDLPTVFSCSYSSSTQVVAFPPIDLPADGVTYETFSPYIIIPNNETFKFIVKDNGSAGVTINNVSTTTVGQSLVNPYVGQAWEETIINPYGTQTVVHTSQDEFYNGEFSGSNFVVENGELNEANPFKQVPTTPTNYTLDLWGSEFGTSENTFLNTVIPSAGTASFWSQNANALAIPGNPSPYVKWAKIHSIDLQGNDNSLSLQNLETLVTNYFRTRGPFIIISISPRNGGDHYVFEFAPGNAAYSFPGPPVGNVTITNRQVVFSPYLTSESGPFQNSDYNAIINNATENRLSQWYQQVDYATNQVVPVNFQQIISGTATPAAVQDSNYTSYQYSGIRYIGSKNTTDDFNNASTTIASDVENQTNVDLGNTTLGLPSVDLNRTYFSYFNWAGGSSPEWGNINEDKTIYSIRYFIDENGNIIRPLNSPDGIALGIMNQNFTEGENAVSSLLNTNITSYNLSVLNGTYPIFKSGKTIQPILYSQTQSASGNTISYGYTSSIGFNVQLGTTGIPNYGFQAFKNATQTSNNIVLNTTNNIVLTFPNEAYDYQNDFNTGTSIYTFGADTEVEVSFRAFIRHTVDFLWEDPFITPNQSMTIQFAIQSGSGATWTDLATKNVLANITTTGIIQTNITTPSRLFKNGDQIRVVMKTYSVTPNPFNERADMSFLVNSYFNNSQVQGGFTVPTASGTFWETGSASRNVLTASVELTSLYGYQQTDISSSGFNSINYPFEVQPYDEIRFEAIEPNAYTILSSLYTDRVYLFLDRDITPASTDLNFFLLRRYVDDPAYLILDVDKPAGASGGGIIKPEFLAEDINQSINQIIENLEERGLLPTQ
jgi:hypothetical protein